MSQQTIATPRLPGVTRTAPMQLPSANAVHSNDLYVFMPNSRRLQLRKVMVGVAIAGVIFGVAMHAAWFFIAAAGSWMTLVFSQKSLSSARSRSASLKNEKGYDMFYHGILYKDYWYRSKW